MEREYRMSVGYKIFYGLVVAVIAGFEVFILLRIKAEENSTPALILSLSLFLVAVLLCVYIIKRKVIISNHSISVSGILGTRELVNENVKGFRVKDKAIFVYPLQHGYRRIMINEYDAIEKTSELIETLSQHYIDLDELERTNALNELLNDNDLGYTESERNSKLEGAKKKALIYNIGGGILFLSVFLKNYDFAICLVTFIYPLLGVFLIVFGKGIIKFFTKKNSPLPSVYIGIYVPSMVLMIVAITDYHLITLNAIWIPFLLIFSLLVIVIGIRGIAKTSGKTQFFVLFFIALFYGYGSTLMINCGFDNSAAETFNATVIDKHKAKDVPYVLISGWGNYQESNDIKVVNSFYNDVQIGSTVHVQLKTGLLNIPWYYISQ